MPKVTATTKRTGKNSSEVNLNLPPEIAQAFGGKVRETHPEKTFLPHAFETHDCCVALIRKAIAGYACDVALRALSQVIGEAQHTAGIVPGYAGGPYGVVQV